MKKMKNKVTLVIMASYKYTLEVLNHLKDSSRCCGSWASRCHGNRSFPCPRCEGFALNLRLMTSQVGGVSTQMYGG